MQRLFLCFVAMFSARSFASSFTYEQLVQVVSDPKRNIQTIDDLLAQPEVTSDYRSNFTAMFESRSAQGADPLNPRIILYGEDAKLMMAFTCAPGDCVGKPKGVTRMTSLEVIHWIEKDKRFEFRTMEFPEGQRAGGVKISQANPDLCLSCHTDPDPRPNWEPYFTWPGAYGGDDDHLAGHMAKGESLYSLQKFLKTGESRPRYRRLVDLVLGYDRKDRARDRKEHNIDMTERVGKLNVLRIVDRMRNSDYFANLKYAFWLDADDFALHNVLIHQMQDAGLDDIAVSANACLHPFYLPGQKNEFASATGEAARLVYALNYSSMNWFLSFLPTLKSEIVSPGQVDNDLNRTLAPYIDMSLTNVQKNALAVEGWRALAKSMDLKSAFADCAAEAQQH